MKDRYTHTLKEYAIPALKWIALAAVALWNLSLFWPRTPNEATLSYSNFLNQLKAGQVASVQIIGSEIRGNFNLQGKTTQEHTNAQPKGSAFRTVYPTLIGDPGLISLLQTHNVRIEVITPTNAWLDILTGGVLPVLLLISTLIWVLSGGLKSKTRRNNSLSRITRKPMKAQPEITFEQVGGHADAKLRLKSLVNVLREASDFTSSSTPSSHGVLFLGPAGAGRTYLARALAGEAGVPFFDTNLADLFNAPVKAGFDRIKDMFKQAEAAAPAIIFLNNLEALGHSSIMGIATDKHQQELLLYQLLVEMDQIHPGVVLVAASEHPELVNAMLMEKGKFDQQITLGMPDRNDRQEILRIHTRRLKLAKNVDLNLLARTTPGISPAGLAALCRQAARLATQSDHNQVEMADFELALEQTLMNSVNDLLLDDHQRHVIAYHEAGHILASWLIPQAEPIRAVSIITPRHAPDPYNTLAKLRNFSPSRHYLLSYLKVLLAGRAAEELELGDITSFGEHDLIIANRLCRSMVARWGMSSLGLMIVPDEGTAIGEDKENHKNNISVETATRIDHAVKSMLEEQYQEVADLMQANRSHLEHLAKAILDEETLSANQIDKYIGVRNEEETPKNISKYHISRIYGEKLTPFRKEQS